MFVYTSIIYKYTYEVGLAMDHLCRTEMLLIILNYFKILAVEIVARQNNEISRSMWWVTLDFVLYI